MTDIQKDILLKALSIKLKKGEDLVEVVKGYTKLSDEDKKEILKYFGLEPYQLTLDELKTEKIKQFSEACKQIIENGVTIDIDGVEEKFSYSIENGDQGNIDDLFNLARSTMLPQPYHCDGGDCKLYTIEQIFNLYIAVKSLKAQQTTYFNQLKNMIKEEYVNDTDIESLKELQYGDELTGKYLETYNAIMNQSLTIIQALTTAEASLNQ